MPSSSWFPSLFWDQEDESSVIQYKSIPDGVFDTGGCLNVSRDVRDVILNVTIEICQFHTVALTFGVRACSPSAAFTQLHWFVLFRSNCE